MDAILKVLPKKEKESKLASNRCLLTLGRRSSSLWRGCGCIPPHTPEWTHYSPAAPEPRCARTGWARCAIRCGVPSCWGRAASRTCSWLRTTAEIQREAELRSIQQSRPDPPWRSARKSRSLGSEVTPTEPSLPPSRAQRRSWERTSPHSVLWHALDYFNDVLVANYHAWGFMTSDEFINHIQDVCAFINAFAGPFKWTAIKKCLNKL